MASAGVMKSNGWLRTFTPRPEATVRLVCFPYAGGGAGAYRPLARLLPPSIELVAVQYPGRQDRYREQQIADLGELVHEAAAVVSRLFDRPVALFGHSLGALVSFEVTRRLRAGYSLTPAALFVSARKSPGEWRPTGIDFRQDEEMRAYLGRLGERAKLVLDDEELWPVIVPALRNDLIMSEGYAYVAGAPLSCPVTAIAAEGDDTCSISEMRQWSKYTAGAFTAHSLPGDHYYVETAPEGPAELLRRALTRPSGSLAGR